MQDPYAHPLHSSVSRPHRLLLKVTRHTAAGAGAAADTADANSTAPRAGAARPTASVEVVARLPVTHAFRGLADFQVVSSTAPLLDRSSARVSAPNQPAAAEPNRAEQPFLVLPPLFSTTDSTFKYGYKPFARKDARASLVWAPSGKQTAVAWGDPCPAALSGCDTALKQVQLLLCA